MPTGPRRRRPPWRGWVEFLAVAVLSLALWVGAASSGGAPNPLAGLPLAVLAVGVWLVIAALLALWWTPTTGARRLACSVAAAVAVSLPVSVGFVVQVSRVDGWGGLMAISPLLPFASVPVVVAIHGIVLAIGA